VGREALRAEFSAKNRWNGLIIAPFHGRYAQISARSRMFHVEHIDLGRDRRVFKRENERLERGFNTLLACLMTLFSGNS
jgi:hypothetical protein